jgi:hypothetical protein
VEFLVFNIGLQGRVKVSALTNVINQNTPGDSQGYPLGVPTSYSWYGGDSGGTDSTPPSNFSSVTGWGQIYPEAGEPVDSTATVQIENFQTYVLLSNGSWELVQNQATDGIDGAHYVADFSGNSSIPWSETTSSDGSVSVDAPPSGYNDHYYPGVRGTYTPGTVVGVFVEASVKTNDASANLVANLGADWWASSTASFVSGFSNNPGVGQSDWVKLTTQYQSLYFTSLTAAQLAADPPPGLETTTSSSGGTTTTGTGTGSTTGTSSGGSTSSVGTTGTGTGTTGTGSTTGTSGASGTGGTTGTGSTSGTGTAGSSGGGTSSGGTTGTGTGSSSGTGSTTGTSSASGTGSTGSGSTTGTGSTSGTGTGSSGGGTSSGGTTGTGTGSSSGTGSTTGTSSATGSGGTTGSGSTTGTGSTGTTTGSSGGGTSSGGTTGTGTGSTSGTGGSGTTTDPNGSGAGTTTSSSGTGVGTGASGGATPPTVPVVSVADQSLSVSRGQGVSLGVGVSVPNAGDNVTVNITGLPKYETITDNLDHKTFRGSSITLTAAEVNSGLTLNTYYRGHGDPTATLTLTATDSTGTPVTTAAQTITVKDPTTTVASAPGGTSSGGKPVTWPTNPDPAKSSTTHAGKPTGPTDWFNHHPDFAPVATTLSDAGASKSTATSNVAMGAGSIGGAGAKSYALLNQAMAGDFRGDSHFAPAATGVSGSLQQPTPSLTKPLH